MLPDFVLATINNSEARFKKLFSHARQQGFNNFGVGALMAGLSTVAANALPVATIEPATGFEPSTAEFIRMRGTIVLSEAGSQSIAVTWRTKSGAASSGIDFEAREETVIIPAGQRFAPIEVKVLRDSVVEADEGFEVSIVSAENAVATGSSVSWVIRDGLDRPVVSARSSVAGERTLPAEVTVNVPAAAGLAPIPWSLGTPGGPSPINGTAQLGTDVAAASGTLGSGISTLSMPILVDGIVEPPERLGVFLDLPSLVTAGSLSRRYEESLPGVLDVSTDGRWVAVTVGERLSSGVTLANEVRLYERDRTMAGGWRHAKTLDANALHGRPWEGGEAIVRRGVLVIGDSATRRIDIYGENQGGPGLWGLGRSLNFAPAFLAPDMRVRDFDGRQVVVFVSPNSDSLGTYVLNTERDGFSPWPVEEVIKPADALVYNPMVVSIDDTILAAVHPPVLSNDPQLTIFERSASTGDLWTVKQTFPLLVGTTTLVPISSIGLRVKVAGRQIMVSGNNSLPTEGLIFERDDDGTWSLRQRVASGGVAFDGRVLVGPNESSARIGGGGVPWAATGKASTSGSIGFVQGPFNPTSIALPYDLQDGVFVGPLPLSGIPASFPGFFISEPGADIVIEDEDSLLFSISADPPVTEPAGAPAYLRMAVKVNNPLPFPIDVPFHTTNGGTAQSGVDYKPVSGVMRLIKGGANQFFEIPIFGDRIPEGDETIQVELGEPTFGRLSLAGRQATATIKNLNSAVGGAGPIIHLQEPMVGEVTYPIAFPLSASLAGPTSVSFALTFGSATSADVRVIGPVPVPADATAILVPIIVLADTLDEPAETLRLRLIGGTGLTFSSPEVDIVVDDAQNWGATDDVYQTPQNASLVVAGPGVLGNDDPSFGAVAPGTTSMAGTLSLQADGGFTYSPGHVNFIGPVRFSYLTSTAKQGLSDSTSLWRWQHPLDGKDPATTNPLFTTEWPKPGFDDTSWTQGQGLMGYGTLGGGGGEAITTDIGTPPSGSRHSAYFRHEFTAPENLPPGLALEYACDDEAIIYLDGIEVGRSTRVPPFGTAPDTYTLTTPNITDGAAESFIRTLSLGSVSPRPGAHVLALSIHNASPTSSDLGFRLSRLVAGRDSDPVWVTVEVTDASMPPMLTDDVYTVASSRVPIDTRVVAGGSAYANDGLLRADGRAYDPVLEVAIGGLPPGPVAFEKDTGHFKVAAPSGFVGPFSFTYKVRDKDGWSDEARVTIDVAATKPSEEWRLLQFGGNSALPDSQLDADPDGDGLANMIEFIFGRNPHVAQTGPVMTLTRQGAEMILKFTPFREFGEEFFIYVETFSVAAPGGWTTVARFNDTYSVSELRPPYVDSPSSNNSHSLRFPVDSMGGLYRLRVVAETTPRNP